MDLTLPAVDTSFGNTSDEIAGDLDQPVTLSARALPHRMPDDSLCLFYPDDSLERRWHSNIGLLALLDLTRDHLFFEHHWRSTGGSHGGIWLGPEADHGLSTGMVRS